MAHTHITKKVRPGYWIMTGFLLLLAGIGTTVFTIYTTDGRLRESLLSRAQTIAAGGYTHILYTLQGTSQDVLTSAYEELKKSLIKIQEVNNDARFVYLMGLRDGQLFFYADSEPAGSPDESKPGDIYVEATPYMLSNARAGKAFIEGPDTDQWGTWFSGHAPIFDPKNGALLGISGIDISAANWRREVVMAAALPASVTFFVLVLLVFYYRSQKKKALYIEAIEEQEHRLRSLYEITTRPWLDASVQIQLALETGAQALRTRVAVLSRIEGEIFKATYTYGEKFHEGEVYALSETYCDITVKKNEVVAINDMRISKHKTHVCYTKFQFKTYMGVPVMVMGEQYGTLAFFDTEPHYPPFSKSDQDFIRLMGKWVSSVLEQDVLRQKEIEINNMKTEFVSVASHQLRTPLTSIKWIGELLQKGKAGKLKNEQKEMVDQIIESNERMIDLVNDLLHVSRMDTSEKFVIEKKQANIIELIDAVIEECTPFAVKNGVKIVKSPSTPKIVEVAFDKKKIEHVFQNLIGNAIKYSTPKSTITIVCTVEAGQIICSVTNTGVGIPKHAQSKIFHKFFRAPNVTSLIEGTGLGLYIAKAIVEGHEGKIWFESEEGKETTFYISLPL